MPRAGLLVGVVIVFGLADRAGAQVHWRTDYSAARKEAAAAGRPLLLDFGTENCFWCKKLDTTTFQLPAVAQAINDRVVPVKVDAEKQEWLSRAAGVDSYPTLILVSPDGKVLARHVGYADGAKMSAFLAQLPAAAPRNPAAELIAQARADHDAGRLLACVERCDRVLISHPGSPEAADARRLLARITADPHKWQRVTAQIDGELAALQRSLGAALPK